MIMAGWIFAMIGRPASATGLTATSTMAPYHQLRHSLQLARQHPFVPQASGHQHHADQEQCNDSTADAAMADWLPNIELEDLDACVLDEQDLLEQLVSLGRRLDASSHYTPAAWPFGLTPEAGMKGLLEALDLLEASYKSTMSRSFMWTSQMMNGLMK